MALFRGSSKCVFPYSMTKSISYNIRNAGQTCHSHTGSHLPNPRPPPHLLSLHQAQASIYLSIPRRRKKTNRPRHFLNFLNESSHTEIKPISQPRLTADVSFCLPCLLSISKSIGGNQISSPSPGPPPSLT